MNDKLSGRQSLFVSALIFSGILSYVLIAIDAPLNSTGPEVILGCIGFFVILAGFAVGSRIEDIPSEWPSEQRREEKRRVLGELGWGCTRALAVVFVFAMLAKYFWLRVDDQKFILISGYGAIAIAFAPIIKILR